MIVNYPRQKLIFQRGMAMTKAENSNLQETASPLPEDRPLGNGENNQAQTYTSYRKELPHTLHLTHEEVQRIIAESAYLKAKLRDFEAGHDFQDWISSEKDIINKLVFLGIDFTLSQ